MTDKQYSGPTVYRVITVYPAVQIEFSGEELELLFNALGYGMAAMQPGLPESETLHDMRHRVHRALTAMRSQNYATHGERRVMGI